MTAKAAAGFTLRTHKGIERGGGLLPALGAALLLAGIAGQVCSAMGMPVDGLLLLAGMAAAVCAAALTGRRDRLALLPLGVLLVITAPGLPSRTAISKFVRYSSRSVRSSSTLLDVKRLFSCELAAKCLRLV